MNMISQVFLAVDSESLSAVELQSLMGAPSDEGWSVGDVYWVREREKVSTFSRWSFSENAPSASLIEEAVDRLVARLRPLEETLSTLPKDLRIALSICATQQNSVFGVGVSAASLMFLARIGAELDISVVVQSQAV
jgi:hypothetical protein